MITTTHLFTAAKVLRATQQIVMTAVFFYYLSHRIRDGRKVPRASRRFDRFND
jgi:hypothetical protein